MDTTMAKTKNKTKQIKIITDNLLELIYIPQWSRIVAANSARRSVKLIKETVPDEVKF
jgi:hypothetical protein